MTTREALFAFVKISIKGKADEKSAFDDIDWKELYETASKQGVLSTVWNGIEIQSKAGLLKLSIPDKMFWLGMVKKYEAGNDTKRQQIIDFVHKIEPIRCIILKGLDYARYWPDSKQRSFGDLDIWSDGQHSEINQASLSIGGKVEGDTNSKHNEIDFGELHIENHLTFVDTTHPQGKRENEILRNVYRNDATPILASNLLSPNVNFTALFMLKHLQNHFLYEGVRMRLVMDWVYFIEKEKKKIDWDIVMPAMKELRIKNLADFLTDYAEYLRGEREKTHIMNDLEELFFEPAMDRRLDLIHSAIRFMNRCKKRWHWHKYIW